MANYATLKAAINAVIKANGNKEITGTVLNETLTAMVNSLGADYQFAGVATPSTNPGTPDQNVAYLASQAGTYTNFNAVVLPAGIHLLLWNGTWSTKTFFTIDDVPTAGSDNLVKSGGVLYGISESSRIFNNSHYIDLLPELPGYLESNGTYSIREGNGHFVICVNPGDTVTVDTTGNRCFFLKEYVQPSIGHNRALYLSEDADSPVFVIPDGSTGENAYTFSVPNDTHYIAFTSSYYSESFKGRRPNSILINGIHYNELFTDFTGKYVNGDTITLKITGDGVETLKMEGYVITDTIEITVEGLPEYITSVEQLTDEMKSEAMDRINADFERHSKYIFNAWRNCSVEDFYWGTIKPDAIVYNELDLRDRLCIVATYEIDGKQYKIAYYPDIIIFEDGSYQMNIDYMDGFYCNNNVFYENYDFEEIEEW
jgi:hypothetical protein